MPDFTKRTRSYTDARLFDILREAEKYAPEAVTAAEKEIERRNLTEGDFPAAPADKPFARVGKMMSKLKPPKPAHRHDGVIDWFEQPDEVNEKGEKYLLYLMIVMAITGLIGIYDQLDYLRFAFAPEGSGFDVVTLVIILAVLIQFFLVYLLWRKNRIGYYVSAGFAAVALVGTLFLTPYLLQSFDNSVGGGLGGLIDYFTPVVNPYLFVINLGLSVAVIWLVTRTDLMAVFGTSKRNLIIAIALGGAYSLFSNLMVTY